MRLILTLAALLWASLASAGTIYIDTAANGSAAANFSGSTDATAITVGGSTSTFTSGTDVVVEAGKDISTGIVTTAGPTQSSVYLTGATNTNKKIFWITGIAGSGGATPTLTLDSAPTCAANACGVWNIGGRAILTNASQEGALRAGDTVIFNISPATQSATSWTFRLSGDTTSGYATIMGKAGTRPVLNTSGSANPTINTNSTVLVRISNLEIKQSHASNGVGISLAGGNGGILVDNVKVSAAGTIGITDSVIARFANIEITGTVGDCFDITNNSQTISGAYVHDCGADGIENSATGPIMSITDSVIDTNVGRGIFFSSGSVTTNALNRIVNTTVYNNGNSGIEVTDADLSLSLLNDIVTENGNASGEYNVEYVAGSIDLNGYHAYNTFWCTGLNANVCTSGASNVLGLTVNNFVTSSEILVDPLMSNPGSGNFVLSAGSPAAGTGFPGTLLGSGSVGYMSMGAEQVQGSTGTGSHSLIIGGP